MDDRFNSEGIPRRRLSIALRTRRVVLTARRIDSCLLCKRPEVNEAGVCAVCYAILNDEELGLAERWMRGQGP